MEEAENRRRSTAADEVGNSPLTKAAQYTTELAPPSNDALTKTSLFCIQSAVEPNLNRFNR